MSDHDTLTKILDLARWAPSGDNTQPWRFEIAAHDHIVIHGHDTRSWCLYDFDGHASHMAHGALLETLKIAASAHSLRAEYALRNTSADNAPTYDVRLFRDDTLQPHPSLPFVEKRTVQRRPMGTNPLTPNQQNALTEAIGPDYRVQFFESFQNRFKIARLLWANAHIRLTCPEAYRVHRDVIEWNASYSEDRMPGQAIGVDPMTAKLMRWVMQSWERVAFFNRYLLGTIPPRIQLDFLPALACASHLLIRPLHPLVGNMEYVRAGEAMQRLWLAAASQGLSLQPEMTPIIFRWYARTGRSFSSLPVHDAQAARLAEKFEEITQADPHEDFAFFCRIGHSAPVLSRSLRKPLQALVIGAPRE